MSIAANLDEIRARMLRAAERGGRRAEDVTLVGVTKTLPAEKIREAIEAGVRNFGENRVQEAEGKYGEVGLDSADKIERGSITLHMIGGLQRNKAKRAVELFDWVQSVDRVELLATLDRAVGELGKERLPILIEVNTTEEAAKSGVAPGELGKLVDVLGEFKRLRAMGLMTVARMGASERELRETFGGLRGMLEGLRKEYGEVGEWTQLSMGMSDDYEIAIEEGATMVRLGRALFGARA